MMATTTPPLRPIVEPPAPLHGPKYDSYVPYEPRRRSSRLRTLRTPSPTGLVSSSSTSTKATRSGFHNLSPPSSPLSPESRFRKRRREDTMVGDQMQDDTKVDKSQTIDGLLPTPVKTPRKKEVKTNLKPTARVLFPHRLDTIEDVMPVPRKKGKKIGFSLDSPGASSDGKIEIFEDSKEKIPEVDKSAENPFYDKPETRSAKRKGKRKAEDSVDHSREVQEVLERDEGMIYVFRGKKVYRKFEDDDYDQPPMEGALAGLPAVNDPNTTRHFTRSSVKPRFLFPTSSKARGKTGDTTDEEAITDIEYPEELRAETESKDKEVKTPAKNRFYATPPTTARATRTTAKRISPPSSPIEGEAEIDSPFTVKRAKKSPFESWQRSKPGSSSASASGRATRKRDAESPIPEGGPKRQKGKA